MLFSRNGLDVIVIRRVAMLGIRLIDIISYPESLTLCVFVDKRVASHYEMTLRPRGTH